MGRHELLQQPGREERRVAGEDEHVARGACERDLRGADRVAGAERLLLDGDLEALEGVGAIGRDDDDQAGELERARRLEHPVHHPPAEDRMEVLRHRGTHPGAEAAGHDER